jgi:hypothetical protein
MQRRWHDFVDSYWCLNLNATKGVICHRPFFSSSSFIYLIIASAMMMYGSTHSIVCVYDSIVSSIIPFFFSSLFLAFPFHDVSFVFFWLTHCIHLTMQKSGLKVLLPVKWLLLFFFLYKFYSEAMIVEIKDEFSFFFLIRIGPVDRWSIWRTKDRE